MGGPKPQDLTGQRFGRLTVIELAGRCPKRRLTLWLCRCDCGAEKVVPRDSLMRGSSISCGCYQKECAAIQSEIVVESLIGKVEDLVGKRFGRLEVLGYVGRHVKGRKSIWLCVCDCGEQIETIRQSLIGGRTKSCGCLASESAAKIASTINKTHGDSGSAEYGVWRNIITRCHYPKSDHYQFYGARGIRVCDRWRSYENFLADMGRRPSANYSIERNDTNCNYEPNNCRWATQKEQTRNRRDNRYVIINGVTKIITDWCIHYGINKTTVYGRLKRGWSEIDALTTQVQ